MLKSGDSIAKQAFTAHKNVTEEEGNQSTPGK